MLIIRFIIPVVTSDLWMFYPVFFNYLKLEWPSVSLVPRWGTFVGICWLFGQECSRISIQRKATDFKGLLGTRMTRGCLRFTCWSLYSVISLYSHMTHTNITLLSSYQAKWPSIWSTSGIYLRLSPSTPLIYRKHIH